MIKQQLPDFLGCGWSFPVTCNLGQVLTSAGADNIKQSIVLILQTAKGERIMRPEFGSDLNQLIFAPCNDSTFSLASSYVRKSLSQWEPRINVKSVEVTLDNQQAGLLLININYIIIDKNTPDNLVYPFYLNARQSIK